MTLAQPTAAMRGVLTRLERAARPPLHTLDPPEARAAYEAGAAVLELDAAPLARVDDFTLGARDGHRMPARLYAPSPAVLPVAVFFHGGGFTIGSIATHDVLCRELARLSGCAVVSVEYRLAPEHRFPTAHDDAWDALRQLASEGASWGLDVRRLAVAGDSAGGTLAACCALRARDAGLPLAAQILFYPGCAPRETIDHGERHGRGLVLESAHIEWFYRQYVDPAQRVSPAFAPLLAPDLGGVAPAWIGLAELDPLHDEGVAYADRLRESGVPVALEVYRGVTHEFIKMGRAISQARDAHRDAALALQGALKP